MEDVPKHKLELELTKKEIENYKGLDESEALMYGEFFDFLCQLIDEQCDPWVAAYLVNGAWYPSFKDGALSISYDPDLLSSQKRDKIQEQLMDAIARTPNRYLTLEKGN